MSGLNLTERIADFVVRSPLAPEAVIEQACDLVLDALGVALGGSVEETTKRLKAVAGRLYGSGAATVLPDEKSSPAGAAWVNGTAAHALDFDDVSAAYNGHPSAPIFAATLAVAETERASGREFLESFAIGVEVASVVGQLLGPNHYVRGLHTTPIVGVFGATAAATRILGLSDQEVRCALGIAASHATGLKKNFGTMTKPLHSGAAARSGVEAAYLAAEGFTANRDVFAGNSGLLALLDAHAPEAIPGVIGRETGDWLLTEPGIAIKLYPCCYMLASALDGCARLYDGGVRWQEIQGVHVEFPQGSTTSLPYDTPSTGLEAKFSVPYTIATCLIRGTVDLSSFEDSALQREDVRELMERISYSEGSETASGEAFAVAHSGYAVVTVTLATGNKLSERVERPRGAPGNALRRRELKEKFLNLTEPVLSDGRALALLERAENITSLDDVGSLFD